MQDHVSDPPENFGYNVDSLVDELDRAYQDGMEDLGNQLIELIRDYELAEFPAEIVLPNLTRFIENSIGFTQDEDDDDDFDWLDDYDLENELLEMLDDDDFLDDFMLDDIPPEFPEAA